MKATQKIFIINAAVAASFLVGFAGASAQQAQVCTSDTDCPSSAPYCSVAGPVTATTVKHCSANEMKNSAPAGTCTSDSQCGAGFKCTGAGPKICTPDCGGTILPNTIAPSMGTHNPNVEICQYNNGRWNGPDTISISSSGAMTTGFCSCNAGFTPSFQNPNMCMPILNMPQPMSPGADLINPASRTNGLGGNVLQAFWNFITHRQ